MAMKIDPYKMYEMQPKLFLEGSSQSYMPSSENKKNLKQPKLPPKRIRKKEQTKPKGSRRKEIIKIRGTIHKIKI